MADYDPGMFNNYRLKMDFFLDASCADRQSVDAAAHDQTLKPVAPIASRISASNNEMLQ